MRKSKLIYIASPYAGDIEKNVAFARRALWVCGDRISSGMVREISEANHLSIPVKNIGAHEIQKEQLPAEMEQVTASGQGLGMT